MSFLICLALVSPALAQNTVTGAFEGTVTDSLTGNPIGDARVEITNQETRYLIVKRTDSRGRFYQGLLIPGVYKIRISVPNFQTREVLQRLNIARTGEVVPVPVTLDPVTAGATPATPTAGVGTIGETDIRGAINTSDARRSGAFTEEEVTTLPLGATTLTRTFDEQSLLLPGVAPPPQTLGRVAGPGLGSGVGSAGQFAVNGLRSRANNFTVDGSDNNDEDIGVRRQGFVALIPQPIESIKEYQVIALLAPAQFGRNIGAQVNAVSKSGGSETHGSIYGFLNTSHLNARNFFDTTNGTAVSTLRENNQNVILQIRRFVRDAAGRIIGDSVLSGQPLTVRNQSGGEDSFTLAKVGFVVGGPLKRDQMFYFISAEGQTINATQEASFAVPTIEQRGPFRTGVTGIFRNPFDGTLTRSVPNTSLGAAFLSLFPFPNNPQGVYGANTFTQVLPASGRGLVLSGKLDHNFKFRERQQSVTARYNFTNDWREIPVTGEAIFSSIRPRVRTHNFSFFSNSELSGLNSNRPIFNQVRLSYGRTRLAFAEVRDTVFQIPSEQPFAEKQFLLNVPYVANLTAPATAGVPNQGPVIFAQRPFDPERRTTESVVGSLGQLIVAGFSSVGVDVFNFPQQRINNTYQAADVLTIRTGNHSFALGGDFRRTELNSDLPRNSRTAVNFNGAPRLDANLNFTGGFIRPEDLAATGAASSVFLTLATGSSKINLRFYQLDFFAQDECRIRPKLSLSYGLRYELNTPPHETNQLIERTFSDPALNLIPGLQRFIAGRTRIFDPDYNNFAPRLSLAYSPELFGKSRTTVFRGGYGLFYDQIVGAVVSQSRNVFPTFLTLNTGGGLGPLFTNLGIFDFFNPASGLLNFGGGRIVPYVAPGTLNRFNPVLSLNDFIETVNSEFRGGFGATLPARQLDMPLAHHYTFTVEQQLSRSLVASAAYVGTEGRHLLRFTTPNLGQSSTLVPLSFVASEALPSLFLPIFSGTTRTPLRPVSEAGTINRFETTAQSRYDSLQLQVRGRFGQQLQYQAAYTLSKAADDVSDVFDLAGASALPQNSITLAGEWGSANFDAHHRFSYNFVYQIPQLQNSGRFVRLLLDGLQIAGTGRYQTGQPFTVNSISDVNLDGNLTDRLNTTAGLVMTGNGRQPLRLTSDPTTLLAPVGQDGKIGRNTFRAASLLELDLSVSKRVVINHRQSLSLRMDAFNVINRANFGIPIRLVEAVGFGQAVNTVTPGRRLQFELKYSF